MSESFTPILVVPAIPFEGGIRFLHREDQIDIDQDMAETLWSILSFANGYNDIATIAEKSGLPKADVSEIISELCDMELMVDSREQFMHFHRISSFPSCFNYALTQDEIEEYTSSKRLPVKQGDIYDFRINENTALHAIREKRRSCRNFSDKKLSASQIGSICHYAYSISDHTVPSGGALYPLKIYVLIESEQDDLGAGYYEYDAELNRLICFDKHVDVEQLKYCFSQEDMPFNSSIQIIIAADLKRQPFKYSNRGYRLTLIEVGHAAENICLYCAEQGLGACEMGGVQDEALKTELELSENVWPILAIPLGYPAECDANVFNKIRYVEEKVGDGRPVDGVWADTFGENGSFFGATSSYCDANGDIQFAGATSPSYPDALFKATIEAYERWLSSQLRVDYHGPANELKGAWIKPNEIVPLTAEQSIKAGLKPFSEELSIDWTKGVTYDGTEIYVPSDIVYYGQKDSDNRIYYGNSSGIAAYFDADEAKKRALVELIERDALMRNWYRRESPYYLGPNLLPIHVKKRIKHWAKQNRALVVLQMPSEYGWVFEAVIVSKEYPLFISGAAATIDKDGIDAAINKALQEAEYGLLMALKYPNDSKVNPKTVSTPSDHGEVYRSPEYIDELNWLFEGETEAEFVEPKYTDFTQLQEKLEAIFVDLSDNSSDLKVVRALSTKLVPINFGYNSAHYTHPMLKGEVHPRSIEMPHYFA